MTGADADSAVDADPRVLVAGETLVDFLPDAPGPLPSVESFSRRPGGAPANVAVALARLEETPHFWTRIGADPFGDFLVETLADDGVPDAYLERDPEAKTSLAFVTHGADADRGFTFYRDGTADTRMRPGAVPDEALADAEWVHVGGVTMADEPSREATFDLIRRANEAGTVVSFDPNARPELWTDFPFAETVRVAFELVDVAKVTPADLDAAGIEGEADELARLVCEYGPDTTLLTLGGAGAYGYSTESAPWSGGEATAARHTGYTVEPVDTTGAGDAFTAGAVAALIEGESLTDALAFANAVGAVATTASGAMTALPDREAVDSFRAEQGEE